MTFEEYQKLCLNTWIRDDSAEERTELGLIEEVGEVAGKYKKFLRGDYDKAEYDRLVLGELGDVLYYLAMFCLEYKLNIKRLLISDKIPNLEYEKVLLNIKILYDRVSFLLTKRYSHDENTTTHVDYTLQVLEILAGLSGYSIKQVAEANIEKLAKRKANGTIKGNGDFR